MKNTIQYLLIFGVSILIFSCNQTTRDSLSSSASIPVEITPIVLPDSFNKETSTDTPSIFVEEYSTWLIQKKSLGPISIGMDVKTAHSILEGFERQTSVADDFGFSGGSPAYIYSDNNEPILAIVQTLSDRKVFAIIALSEHLKTENGIHSKITVEDLLKFYPKMKFYLDPMNSWESSEDPLNQWDFIFITDSKTRIGLYTNTELPALPKRTNTQCSWIIVR